MIRIRPQAAPGILPTAHCSCLVSAAASQRLRAGPRWAAGEPGLAGPAGPGGPWRGRTQVGFFCRPAPEAALAHRRRLALVQKDPAGWADLGRGWLHAGIRLAVRRLNALTMSDIAPRNMRAAHDNRRLDTCRGNQDSGLRAPATVVVTKMQARPDPDHDRPCHRAAGETQPSNTLPEPRSRKSALHP